MPFPSKLPKEASTSTASAWKKLFASAETPDRTGVTIRNRDPSISLRVCITQKSAAPPSAVDPDDDTMYLVDPGPAYPFGPYADGKCDIYVRAADDSAIGYLAWEVCG